MPCTLATILEGNQADGEAGSCIRSSESLAADQLCSNIVPPDTVKQVHIKHAQINIDCSVPMWLWQQQFCQRCKT